MELLWVWWPLRMSELLFERQEVSSICLATRQSHVYVCINS